MSIKIPYIISKGHFSVHVELQNASNVLVLSESDFRNYQQDRSYNYYGGYYDSTPVSISVNGIGKYYLVVEDSDYRYSFS